MAAGRITPQHPPRPPIPIVPVDATVLERDGWLAAVAPGGELRTRTIVPEPRFPGAGLAVAEVAYEVDAGRALAAQAAADGATVLVATGESPQAGALAAWLDGERDGGPLGALRRLGDGVLCVLVGAALGAGEHGLGYAADGETAHVAGRLAAAVESDLAPRLTTVAALPR